MKQLFWKEWYELRLLPLAAAVCAVVLAFAAIVFIQKYDHQPPQFTDTIPPLFITWGLFGLLAGASLIAQEVGSGSLEFLSSLPVSRAQVWWVKVVTALGVLLLSVVTSTAAWAICDAFWFQSEFFGAHVWRDPAFFPSMGMTLLALLGFFAIALAVSPFLDRPISAAVASLLVALVVATALENIGVLYAVQNTARYGLPNGSNYPTPVFLIFIALSTAVFAAISYWTFTRGESLRSPKRFRVGAISGGISLAIAALVFWSGSLLQWW